MAKGCGENNGEQRHRQACVVRVFVEGEFNVEGAELTLEAEKLAISLKLAYFVFRTLPLSTLGSYLQPTATSNILHHWPELIRLPVLLGDEKTNSYL